MDGPDTFSFLQGIISQNVLAIPEKGCAGSWMLDSSGKTIAWLWICRHKTGAFILTPPGLAEDTRIHLDRYLIMEDVVLSVADQMSCLALIGSKTDDLIANEHLPAYQIFQADICSEPASFIITDTKNIGPIATTLQQQGAYPIGRQAYDESRIEGFKAEFGVDIAAGLNPVIFGLDGLSADKGCYIGQETVAMTRDRGRPPQLFAKISSKATEKLARGETLSADGKPVGVLTSIQQKDGHTQAFTLLPYKLAQSNSFQDQHNRIWTIEATAVHRKQKQ